ncbi:BNR-4 repeat-containing protein [Flammeovirga sp. OC4]|uniref:BNR-4 repeat-containing protein n=1 Tax=Flammeovirga sp. OC4 TaxID=1382345 RepID=UPI00069445A2|nr:BNR-4 repeat-containing protein [Flammeovirga sp. OC4]
MKITFYSLLTLLLSLFLGLQLSAQVTREFEVKVTDQGLYFDGDERKTDLEKDNPGFEFYFGRRITPHGDCIKKYGDFLFLTWYMGGEENKNVMLSRLHIPTQTLETIKFDHTHVGFRNTYEHIGDSHNTIAVGVCPLDSTVHLLYDMHSYSKNDFPDSYFNYQVSLEGAALAPVGSFNRDLFRSKQTYLNASYNYSDITYPNFFLNDDDELFVWFREGGNNNGMYKFAKYTDGVWGPFTNFSTLNAKGKGNPYNWGLYGDLKYINGKLRVGFLKRMSYNNDKYVYNNGFHYGYTNDPSGETEWYNYKGESFSIPLVSPEKLFFYEPGDVVTQGGANSVRISSGVNFTVTDNESVHFITNSIRSEVDNQKKNVHAYKKAGDDDFTITTDFPGGDLYAVDGDIVYLISMKNNKPYILKAEGGTNDWEELYTATDGINMLHSNILIQDGQLFVYAMERGVNGDARPIYIQGYDLGIEITPEEPETDPDPEDDIISSTSVEKAPFKCYGTNGQIKLSEMSSRNEIVVYNLSGVVVYSGVVNSTTLTIPLHSGLYIVNVSGYTKKVFVK